MNFKNEIIKYRKHFLPDLQAIEEFYKMMTLLEAIKNASGGVDPDGKMNLHQRHIGKIRCEKGLKVLQKKVNEIKACNTFEEIFEITEQVRKEIFGLGDLWSYDTALRIGFQSSKHPSKVYMHAGVIKGYKKVFNIRRPNGRSLDLTLLPKEIQNLNPYEAENFLCILGKGIL